MTLRPLEIAALRESRARVFVLTAGNLRGAEIARLLTVAIPRIQGILRSRRGPFIARVSRADHIAIA